MKPNTLSSFAQSLSRRGVQASVLGAVAFAAQVACSDKPSTPGNTQQPFGGTTSSTAGQTSSTAGQTSTTGGTPGAAGTFAQAGTFSQAGMTTGGSFETGGTGGDTAGSGGASAGTGGTTAGTGGTPPDPVAFCKDKTPAALPYNVTEGFKQAGWGGVIASTKTGDQIMPAPAKDFCKDGRATGALGDCSMWQWTAPENAVETDYSFVAWIRGWDSKYTHPEVCLADGAKFISFYARGEVGGEQIKVGGSEATDVAITLTNKWAVYSIPLDGVTYNSFASGFEKGFAWSAAPPTTKITFWIDNIQVVTTLPADPAP